MIAAGDRTAQQTGRAGAKEKWNHLIERETRRGFHASLGRGDPCTQC